MDVAWRLAEFELYKEYLNSSRFRVLLYLASFRRHIVCRELSVDLRMEVSEPFHID